MTLNVYRPNTSISGIIRNIQITSDGQTLTENVALPAYASATVTVVDASSKPISGAYIYLSDSETQTVYEGSTNSSGQLSIPTVVGNYAVGATLYSSTAQSYVYLGGASGTVTAAEDGGNIQITIQPPSKTGTVSGHVYGGTGSTALSGLAVVLADAASGTSIATVYTDSNGAYSFANASVSSSFSVTAEVSIPFGIGTISASQTGSFASTGATVTLDLKLPVSVAEGKVFKHDGVTAVAGATVIGSQTESSGSVLSYDATADANGNYQVPGMEAGNFTLTASSESGLQGTAAGSLATATSTDTMNVLLQPAGTVTGVLKDNKGNPLANQAIVITSSTESAQIEGSTGVNGVYTQTDVATGNIEVQYLNGETLLGSATGALTTNASTLTLNLTLASGTVSGVVYQSDGKSAGGGRAGDGGELRHSAGRNLEQRISQRGLARRVYRARPDERHDSCQCAEHRAGVFGREPDDADAGWDGDSECIAWR